ncbi:MAG: hypothetical protein ACTSWY_02740 [Promethearchaeota archaeon]
MKKIFCGKCGVKSAIFNPATNKGKCHICGQEVDENKIEVVGQYNIFQDQTGEYIRFLKIETEPGKYEIEEKGNSVTIKIFENV